MSWDLSQKAIVVTGGAKGIGLAVVKEVLAHRAGTVIFCSRSPCEDLLTSLREEYPSANIHHVSCDVSTSTGRDELVTRTRQHGVSELHGLVSNVGTNVRKPILEQTENEYNAMMRTNVDSAYFLAKLFFPMFVPGSAIVNVSSAAGVQSSGTGAAYGMTKAALNQMTRALACEWAGKKIRVNAVTPWSKLEADTCFLLNWKIEMIASILCSF